MAGAPPPLKRALTPADGVAIAPRSPSGERTDGDRPAPEPQSAATPAAPGSRLLAAAAMLGMAVGLEVSGLLAARTRDARRLRVRP